MKARQEMERAVELVIGWVLKFQSHKLAEERGLGRWPETSSKTWSGLGKERSWQ